MSRSIIKALPELIKANVISEKTAGDIREFYRQKEETSPNRLVIVFGVLGAILVGLGIILIIAHNWDELNRTTKTLFSFFPLLVGQALCVWVILKKYKQVAWRESTAVFLFFAIGASISLISQVYNIPGNLSAFLLTWILLCFPLMYIMRSSITSLLYLIGITYYACESGYWNYPTSIPYFYWLLFLLAVPHYYLLWRHQPDSNFTIWHHWFVPLSVIITLGTWATSQEEFMLIAYVSLFGGLYIVGKTETFNEQRLMNNGYRLLGAGGTLALLLFLSFDEFWNHLYEEKLSLNQSIITPEFFVAIIISLVTAFLLYWVYKNKSRKDIELMEAVFLIFILTFLVGLFTPILPVVTINILVLILGIITIRRGVALHHLGILNYGLLLITALIICRFFDVNLSFVVRGILFVLVGTGFFLANYQILQKKKALDKK